MKWIMDFIFGLRILANDDHSHIGLSVVNKFMCNSSTCWERYGIARVQSMQINIDPNVWIALNHKTKFFFGTPCVCRIVFILDLTSVFNEVWSVVMSQVFRGDRELTPEQALGVTKFMGLSELERDYFFGSCSDGSHRKS